MQNSDLSEGSFLFHVIIVVPCCPPCGGEASAKNMATAAQTSPFAPRPPHQLQHQLQPLQQQSHRDKSMDIRTPPRRGLVLFGHGHGAFFEGMRRVKCWTKEVSTVDAIGNEATTLLSSCSWLSFFFSVSFQAFFGVIPCYILRANVTTFETYPSRSHNEQESPMTSQCSEPKLLGISCLRWLHTDLG